MSLSKLKQIHVIIIGSFLCVAAGVALFFLMIKPQMAALDDVKKRYDAAIDLGNNQAEQAAMLDVQKAGLEVLAAQHNLDVEMKQRMPNLSFKDRAFGMVSLWQEFTNLPPMISSYAKDKGVAMVATDIRRPDLPTNPNDKIFDSEMIPLDMGAVTAVGDFKSLMQHIKRWNNCGRLIAIDQPSLQVVNGQLTLTYATKCIILPVEKGGAPISIAGDPGAAGTAGAAPSSMASAPGMTGGHP